MRVAIVGAGVGGLSLAAAMRLRAPSVDVRLYERDDGPFERPQGYAIGLKQDGGLQVLDALGLREQVLGGDTTVVTSFVFTDQRGRTLLALNSGGDPKRTTYRVQRRRLKQVLLEAVEGPPMSFGHRCVGFDRSADGLTLRFEGDRRAEADVVVACDGVASAIRQQVIGGPPNYLGLAAIYGDAGVQPHHPLLAGGYFMTLGDDGSSIFCYSQPGGSTHFSYTLHAATEAEVAGLSDRDPADLLATVRTGTGDWHELVAAIVGAASSETIGVRGYYDREPAGSVAAQGVWLLGDAAHPMCPFQGQGANTAMLDAWDLAGVLGSAGLDGGDQEQVAERIVKRGRKAVLDSRRAAAQFHTTSRFRQRNRDIGFRIANTFIALFSRLQRRRG